MATPLNKQNAHLCGLIRYKMELRGIRTLRELAPLVGMSVRTMQRKFADPSTFTVDELRRIYAFLQFEPEEKAKAL